MEYYNQESWKIFLANLQITFEKNFGPPIFPSLKVIVKVVFLMGFLL